VGGIAIGLAAVLSALMLFGCAARTPLRGDIEARSDHVLVGAVLIQLPPPRGMSRLDELKRPEAHLIGQAIIASAPASVRVLRVYVNPEQFQLDKFSLTAIVNVERDLEYVDVSLDAFQARKADLRAVVTSQDARRQYGLAALTLYDETARSIQVTAAQAPPGDEPTVAAISLLLVRSRVLGLYTITAPVSVAEVEALQRLHADWVQSILEANTTESEREPRPGELRTGGSDSRTLASRPAADRRGR
jgi:hypothetical protein